jgi:hypothetical protein
MSPAAFGVGMSADRAVEMFSDAVFIIPDSRELPDQPSNNPVTALVKFLGSMVIYMLRPLALDGTKPMTGNNVMWQASLIANKLSSDREPVHVPAQVMITLTNIYQGYLAFGAFKDVFLDIAYPTRAKFFRKNQDGRPVCPRVIDSAALAHGSVDVDLVAVWSHLAHTASTSCCIGPVG